MSTTIKRNYSKEFTIGDIIFDQAANSVYFYLKAGFFGKTKIILEQNTGGTYDIVKPYYDRHGQQQRVKIGMTFPVKREDETVVEGLTKGTLGLTTAWDSKLEKEIVTTDNALYFTTHKLKKMTAINENLIKVGWVTGVYGTVAKDTQEEATA